MWLVQKAYSKWESVDFDSLKFGATEGRDLAQTVIYTVIYSPCTSNEDFQLWQDIHYADSNIYVNHVDNISINAEVQTSQLHVYML